MIRFYGKNLSFFLRIFVCYHVFIVCTEDSSNVFNNILPDLSISKNNNFYLFLKFDLPCNVFVHNKSVHYATCLILFRDIKKFVLPNVQMFAKSNFFPKFA